MNITIDDASPQFDYVLVNGTQAVPQSLWVQGYQNDKGERARLA